MIQLLDAQGREQASHESDQDWAGTPSDEVGPHIAKIPLRVEYRALLQAAAAYEANAERLKLLTRQAREQAANLKSTANL